MIKYILIITFLFVLNAFALDSLTFIDTNKDEKGVWHISIETETIMKKIMGKFYKIGDVILLGNLSFILKSTNGNIIWIKGQILGTNIGSTFSLKPYDILVLNKKVNAINIVKSKRMNSKLKIKRE